MRYFKFYKNRRLGNFDDALARHNIEEICEESNVKYCDDFEKYPIEVAMQLGYCPSPETESEKNDFIKWLEQRAVDDEYRSQVIEYLKKFKV